MSMKKIEELLCSTGERGRDLLDALSNKEL
jgi:hypothetical protein